MAKSGSTSVSVTSWDDLKFSWWVEDDGQSIASNTTTVNWKMELIAGSSGRIAATATCPWDIEVNGVEYSGDVNVGIANNATKELAKGSTKIAHNADGTKTFKYSFNQYFGITFSKVWITDVGGTGEGTLDTIPRLSQPSCITWPNHTQNVGNFGDMISIHTNRKASSLTHTLRYQFGTKSGTIATGVGTGTTWTIPLDLMDLLPETLSGSGTIYCDTYSGTTKVGTASCGFTATVPDSIKPSCSLTLTDVTEVDKIYGSPVQALSRIKVTVKGTAAYSSPIKSYKVEANGVTYNLSEITTDVLKSAGDSPVTVSVTDARGRTGSASYTMKVQTYTPPVISNIVIRRSDADGTANDEGGYIYVAFSAEISSMSAKNTAAYALRYKKSTEETYTTVDFSSLANKYSVIYHAHIFEADTEETFDVEVVATDRHNVTTRSTLGSTAFTLMDWHASGTGIAFGMVSQKENTMEIALDVEFLGKVSGTIFAAVYPVGSIYLAFNHTDPGTLFPGTTWERIENVFPWFTGGTGTIGQTGGEREVTLTANQIPSHNHGGTYTNAGAARTHSWLASGGSSMGFDTVNTGGGEAHNNMPPYIQISAWRRTA